MEVRGHPCEDPIYSGHPANSLRLKNTKLHLLRYICQRLLLHIQNLIATNEIMITRQCSLLYGNKVFTFFHNFHSNRPAHPTLHRDSHIVKEARARIIRLLN